jgi:hypothetical protein
MFRNIAIPLTFLISSLPAIGHSERITLPGDPNVPPSVIGHTHVFADKDQTIQLNLPGEESIKAQLYRAAGNTVVPAGAAILANPIKNKATPISIDFPQSDKPTQYILIFEAPGKPRLKITALPLEHLHQLRLATGKKPITLVNPPHGLGDTFRQLGIVSRTQSSAQTRKAGILVFFKKQITDPTPGQVLRAKRVIIVNP